MSAALADDLGTLAMHIGDAVKAEFVSITVVKRGGSGEMLSHASAGIARLGMSTEDVEGLTTYLRGIESLADMATACAESTTIVEAGSGIPPSSSGVH